MTIESEAARRLGERVLFGRLMPVQGKHGHARVTIGDGSSMLLSVRDDLTSRLAGLLGEQVEVRVREPLPGVASVDGSIQDVRLLEPGECGPDVPPRSVDELAVEQGIDLLAPPDYSPILSGLWETEEEAQAFRREIRESRGGAR